jgi:hypothetical protein
MSVIVDVLLFAMETIISDFVFPQYMSVTITCLDSVAVLMCHEKLLITGTIGSFAG